MAAHSHQRLLIMDLFKLIASFFVVIIHCNFPGSIGVAAKAIARFAVPFFFLCSGYFLYGSDCKKILNKLIRTVKLCFSAVLLYASFRFACLLLGNTLSEAIRHFLSIFSWHVIVKWIVFNVNIFSVHLWYLDAMVYVYAIHWLIRYFRVSEKFIFASSFVLLGLHLLIWQILLTRGGTLSDATFIVRNFFFDGYPLVGIGMYIRKHREKIPQLTLSSMVLLVILGESLAVLSRYFIGNKSVPIGAIITAITLICYSTQSHKIKITSLLQNSAPYSIYIYVLHPIVIDIVSFAFKKLPISATSVIWQNFKPIAVCFCSLILAVILHHISNKFNATVHRSWPSDEARHGRGLEGLLKRYFK